MILATLVLGASGATRERAIARSLDPTASTALILQGIPDGATSLRPTACLEIVRIAAGCPCCDGGLTLRVTLNRLLRRHPARLYIGLATTTHVEQLRTFLTQPPYDNLLRLTKDLQA